MFNEEELAKIRAAKESWEKKYAQEFEKERKKQFESVSGIPLRRLYTPLDLAEKGFDYVRDLGFPGGYPFERGTTPTMYRGEFVAMRNVGAHGSPEESNKLWKGLFQGGGEPYIFHVYDLPCQLGFDPDHPIAEGEIGKVGVSLASVRDWEVYLDGIDLRQIMICQVMSSLPAIALGNHVVMQEKRGLDVKDMMGLMQNDCIKEYVAAGYYIFPMKHALRQAADIICWAAEHAPHYISLKVCGYHQREKGATPVQEAAAALSSAITYFEAVLERGYVDVDAFAPNITFNTTSSHATFFEDIAKWRAMRRIWAKIVRDRFKAKRPESMRCYILNGSGGLLAYQEEYLNNIPRATLTYLSAILAGVPWCSFLPVDEAFGIPSVESIHYANQAKRVVAYETDINDVVDPLGGSYFIESLTSEVEEKVWEELDAIEKHGGVVNCIESGYFQKQYAYNSHQWQRAFERGEIVRVGVNKFTDFPGEPPKGKAFQIYRGSPEMEAKRIKDIQELKRNRDNNKVKKALSEVKAVAAAEPSRENNIVPPVTEACRCYATLGEIADALREVWGEYTGVGTRIF